MVRISRRLGLATLAFIVNLPGCALLTPNNTPVHAVVEKVMTPTFAAWPTANTQLLEQVDHYCQAQASLADVQNAWRDSARSWARVSPLLLDNASDIAIRVNYWPDKKDLVGLQIKRTLQNPLPTPEQLENSSVALQGLSGLEYLFFDASFQTSSEAKNKTFCPLARLIANRQVELSQQVLKQFDAPNGTGWQLTHTPNTRYPDAAEALTELMKSQVNALELAQKKLAISAGTGVAQPYQAEYWRAEFGLQSVLATLQSSRQLWQLGLQKTVHEKDSDLALSIEQMYAVIIPMLENEHETQISLLKKPAGVRKVKMFSAQIKALHLLYAQDVSKALGIQLGFNANDGD